MAEGRKRNLTELTGNELTVQNTKHVKSVEESANSIVGEQKGVVSNVKHVALGTSKKNTVANTMILEQEDNISDDTLLNTVIDYPKSGNNHSVREDKPKRLESVKTQITQPRDTLIRDSGHQVEAKRLQYLMELESVKLLIMQYFRVDR